MFRVLTGDVEVGEGTVVAVGAGEADFGVRRRTCWAVDEVFSAPAELEGR